jgi:hypothetical protein
MSTVKAPYCEKLDISSFEPDWAEEATQIEYGSELSQGPEGLKSLLKLLLPAAEINN